MQNCCVVVHVHMAKLSSNKVTITNAEDTGHVPPNGTVSVPWPSHQKKYFLNPKEYFLFLIPSQSWNGIYVVGHHMVCNMRNVHQGALGFNDLWRRHPELELKDGRYRESQYSKMYPPFLHNLVASFVFSLPPVSQYWRRRVKHISEAVSNSSPYLVSSTYFQGGDKW